MRFSYFILPALSLTLAATVFAGEDQKKADQDQQESQFNPKEIQVKKSVPNEPEEADGENSIPQTLGHRDLAAAGEGDPDRPVITGRVPNAEEQASDDDRVVRKKPGRTTYQPLTTSDEKEEDEDKGKERKKK